MLLRFHDPDSGAILLDGRDLATIPRAELRRRVGHVEQDAPALVGTFSENVRYAAPAASAADVTAVLRETRLDDLVAQLPGGEDTETVNRASEHCAVLVIAHRLSTVRDADRIVVLERGSRAATTSCSRTMRSTANWPPPSSPTRTDSRAADAEGTQGDRSSHKVTTSPLS